MPAVRRVTLIAVVCAVLAQPTFAADDARLIDQFGRPLDARDLSGHWLMVYFGYAQCPSVCPSALLKMSAVLAQLGAPADSLLPLFVSLDPDRDSPDALRAFGEHFTPRLRCLTGSSAAIEEAARTFGVSWKRQAQPSALMDHGMFIYLVSPDGRVVQEFHPQQSAAEMTDRIRSLLNGEIRR